MKTVKTSKLILLMTLTLALPGAINVFAGNTNDFINSARLHQDKVIKEILKNNNSFLSTRKISMQKMNDYQTTIEATKNKYRNQLKRGKRVNIPEQAIVFVSFSMPDLSLKQIIYDASRYQIPVVVRGLYKNSFRKTLEKIFELVKENNKGGVAINPKWFKEYDIKAVPAVVVVQRYETTGTKSDVVYGNIPLKKALSIIAKRGVASNEAQAVLNRVSK